jgi:lipopolysaccharide/colanic/teichoic acid biosynthesis glycosyltransferase
MRHLPRLNARSIDVAARRVLDVVLALAGLAFFLPLMVAIAAAIRFDTPGPAFFSQLRLGRGGRLFYLYKFRKFPHGLGAAGPAVTLKHDRRMTRIGRVLERAKLDELPQLWNVVVGDMAIVGPRPETLDFADCFSGVYREVLDHRPGLFGPNQVIFRNESMLYPADRDPDEFYRSVLFPTKAHIDLTYFSRRNVLSDVWWLIRGLLVIFGLSASCARCLQDVVEIEARLWPRQARMATGPLLKERN